MWRISYRKRSRNRYGLARVCCLTCLFALVIFAGCATTPQKQQDNLQVNLFELLERQGYQPNIGFSGIYKPGNLIQTQAPDRQGETQPLPTPLIFMWGKDCFPGQVPQVSPFLMPDSAGRSLDSFSLDASLVGLFLPMLKFDRSLISDYRIDLGEARVHTLAKGDLSERFSPRCVDALSRAMAAGDRIEWFTVIVEAVVVDSLNIEMNWQSGTAAAARLGFLEGLQQQLVSVLTGQDQGGLGLLTNNSHQSVLQAKGPVIIGYRMRPLQPVYK